MNKTWLNLIIAGVIILVATIAWEIYQDNTGYRSHIDTSVSQYQQKTLLSPNVEKHIVNDPDFANSGGGSSSSDQTSSTSS